MEAPHASAGRFYRPELDVVRFLAFFLVFLHHTLPSAGDPRAIRLLKGFAPAFASLPDACGFGLSLFFTLSAFLICELLLRERKTAGTIKIKQFYIRRILRIWPLYYLGLLLGLLVMFLPGGHPDEIDSIGCFAVFMSSWRLATFHAFSNPANVLWSISVEEQFYLFAPWVVKFLNRKFLYGFCAALILSANTWLYFLGRESAVDHCIWWNSFVQFECFAGGILLCLVLRGRVPRLAPWQRLALFAFSLCCLFYACYGLHARFGKAGVWNPGSWCLIRGYGLAALSCVLLLVAFLGVDPRHLPKWAIYLGRISFGLYVYHGFAIYASYAVFGHRVSLSSPVYYLKAALAGGLTVLMAAFSYRYFETPFLKMKKRHAVIESQPIEGSS